MMTWTGEIQGMSVRYIVNNECSGIDDRDKQTYS